MRFSKILIAGTLVAVCTLVLLSCEKTFDDKIPVNQNLGNTSSVQVFIATTNAARNLVMVDGKRISRPTLASGSSFPIAIYPSVTSGTYFSVPGGLRGFQILDTAATTTQKPLIFSANMEVNKVYTIFAYDTITNPKQITVETKIEIPQDTTARLRFANFIYDANAVPAVDVFSRRMNQVIFSTVSRTGVTDFITIPSLGTDSFYIREAGTTNVLATYPNAVSTTSFSPTMKRSYTLVYRGSHRGTRTASIFANY